MVLFSCHLVKDSGEGEEVWGYCPGNRKALEMHHSWHVILLTYVASSKPALKNYVSIGPDYLYQFGLLHILTVCV